MLVRKNLLIVGKNSYIGRYFTEYAMKLGADVVALSSKDCDFLKPRDVSSLFASLGSKSYTVIFLAVINKSVANSYQSFLQNEEMVRNLIEGHKLANIESVIYFSSVDVYGKKPSLPITEESKINPDDWYGLSKYACEQMLLSIGELNCPVTVLRIPGVYGNAPNDRSVIGTIAACLLRNDPVRLTDDGRVLRDYVFVDDLCRLLWALIPLKHRGVLNVATGDSLPLAEIVRRVGAALRIEPHLVLTSDNSERDFDLVFETSRLKSLLPDFRFSDFAVGARSYLETKQGGS